MVVSLKTATWLHFSWTRRRPPFRSVASHILPGRNSPLFHPDISYPEFCPPTFPLSGYLTAAILSGRNSHFTRISHNRHLCSAEVPTSPGYLTAPFCPAEVPSTRMSHIQTCPPTFPPTRMSHIRTCPGPPFRLLRMSHIRLLGFEPPNLQTFLAFRLGSHDCKAYP